MTGSNANAFRRTQVQSQDSYADCAEVIRSVRPNDPLYLYCPERLQQRAGEFLLHFPGMVSYAVKANPKMRVLQTLSQAGLRHFDVASVDEIARVSSACPGAVLHFNNPVKAEASVAEAYLRYGVRSFALDEASELDKIHRCTGGDSNVTCTVRFKLEHGGAAYDFGSKFGCSEEHAVQLLRRIAATGARAALTFHPGSQCSEPRMYAHYIEAASRIVKRAGTRVAFLNVGGGFPAYYPGTDLPPLKTYFQVIATAAKQHLGNSLPLLCEPGRGMVAPAVSLLTRVIHVRDCGVSLFVNDGVYGGMQEQSLIDMRLPVIAWRDGKRLRGDAKGYRIFGPTCDPVDRLSRETTLPAGLRPGDYIEFGLLGAYGSATSTRFNGFSSGTYVNVDKGTNFVA